jgi:hypothetical protein
MPLQTMGKKRKGKEKTKLHAPWRLPDQLPPKTQCHHQFLSPKAESQNSFTM